MVVKEDLLLLLLPHRVEVGGYSKTRSTPNQPLDHHSPSARQNQTQGPPPPLCRTNTSTSTYSGNEEGYAAVARRQIASAYNALPAIRSQSPTRSYSGSSESTSLSNEPRANPPLPTRRGISSYPAAAARWAVGTDIYSSAAGDLSADAAGTAGAPYDKKLEIWRRRWQRSEEMLRARKVVLKTWRVGSDVSDECLRLAQRELERQETRAKGAVRRLKTLTLPGMND